jgi:hypothetical protein
MDNQDTVPTVPVRSLYWIRSFSMRVLSRMSGCYLLKYFFRNHLSTTIPRDKFENIFDGLIFKVNKLFVVCIPAEVINKNKFGFQSRLYRAIAHVFNIGKVFQCFFQTGKMKRPRDCRYVFRYFQYAIIFSWMLLNWSLFLSNPAARTIVQCRLRINW